MSDENIIDYMLNHDDPAFTTREIADYFDMTPPGIRNRLEDLAKAGEIKRKKPANRTVIWWHPGIEDQLRCSE